MHVWLDAAATVFCPVVFDVAPAIEPIPRGLTVNPLRWETAGDEASGIILGMLAWLEQAGPMADADRREATHQIETSDLLVGCRFDGSDDVEEAQSLLLRLAGLGGGVIFNGSALLASTGRVLVEGLAAP